MISPARRVVSSAVALCVTSLAGAQVYTTVPFALDTTPSNVGVYGPAGNNIVGTVCQAVYSANALKRLPPGSVITSIQLRQTNFGSLSAWPSSNQTVTDYRITLAQTNKTPATVSQTYADNLVLPVLVRSGALTLPASAYPAAEPPAAAPWGPIIAFQTPYIYQGGGLVIEIRNTGSGSNTRATDSTSWTSDSAGYFTINGANATSGSFTLVPIIRIGFYTAADIASPLGDGVTKVFAMPQYIDIDAPGTVSTPAQSQPRTMVSVIDSGLFSTLGRGSWFTGMSFRSNGAADWPGAALTFSKYDVQLSRALTLPGTLANTVASNVGADAVNVRSGVLTVAAGAMQADTTPGPSPFTWEIPFNTPYSYRGGPLLSVVRHDGAPTAAGSVDAIPTSDALFNSKIQTRVSLTSSTDTQAATSSAFPITRYSVDAQTIVPLAAADTPTASTNNGNAGAIASPASTYQVIIAASELKYIQPGSIINSVSFQNLQSAFVPAWPTVMAYAPDYRIELSQARRTPSTMSTTFALNEGGDKLQVRSGPIAFAPGALPAGGSKSFGATITFDRGYVYQGGDLCVTIRKSALTGADTKLQGAGPSSLIRGVYRDGSAATQGNFDSVSAGTAMQFGYIPSDQTPSSVRFVRQDAGYGRYVLGGSLTHQMMYNPEVISVPVGAMITGVSWKLYRDNEPDFPANDLSFDRFDITLSSAPVRADAMVETFALNDGSDLIMVRSGPLVIPARSYRSRAGSSSNDFGYFIPFTKPFVYRGGPLTMTLRESAGSSNSSVDFEATTVGSNGYRSFTGPDETTGTQLGDAMVSQFAFTLAARCPSDLNNDGIVDDSDFLLFLPAYNTLDCADAAMPFGCPSDLNDDRTVDDDDFLIFLVEYNNLLCP